MGTPLRTYIATRRAEVVAEIKALRAELKELRAAEEALEPLDDGRDKEKVDGESGKTLKAMAVAVLTTAQAPMKASAIIEGIKLFYGQIVVRESLSPQLSRLAQEGIIGREGRFWYMPQFSPKPDFTPAPLVSPEEREHA